MGLFTLSLHSYKLVLLCVLQISLPHRLPFHVFYRQQDSSLVVHMRGPGKRLRNDGMGKVTHFLFLASGLLSSAAKSCELQHLLSVPRAIDRILPWSQHHLLRYPSTCQVELPLVISALGGRAPGWSQLQLSGTASAVPAPVSQVPVVSPNQCVQHILFQLYKRPLNGTPSWSKSGRRAPWLVFPVLLKASR